MTVARCVSRMTRSGPVVARPPNVQVPGMSARLPVCDAGLMLRCLIVDDSRRFLDAARDLLEREGIAVPGVASTSAEAVQRVRQLRPDVVLVDIDLGRESGFEVARQLHGGAHPAPPRIILISTRAEQDYADLIAASPAVGFLAKAALSAHAIRDLLDGDGIDDAGDPVSGPRGR
jgi:CheY-like chemotaxis protein